MAGRLGCKKECRDQQDNRLNATKEKKFGEEDHIDVSDGISPSNFESKEASEVFARLEKQMDEDIEALLNDPTPVKPYHFSEDYEKKLEQQLTEKFGSVQAQLILEARQKVRKNAEQDYIQYIMSEDFLSSSYADISDRDSDTSTTEHISLETLQDTHKKQDVSSIIPMRQVKKTSKVHHGLVSKLAWIGHSKAVKAASVLLTAAVLTLVFNKDVANAYWWEDLSFLMENFDEYSRLDMYEDIYSETTEYPDTIEKVYVPSVVAEGYEEVDRSMVSKQIRITYCDDNEQEYVYMQQTRDIGLHINTEDTYYTFYETEYGRAYYRNNLGVGQLILYYENYVFTVEGNINSEQMIKIINSISLEEKDE